MKPPLLKKIYPNAVRMRPILLKIGVIAVLAVIACLVVVFATSLVKHRHATQHQDNTAQTLASNADTLWYQQAESEKPKVDNRVIDPSSHTAEDNGKSPLVPHPNDVATPAPPDTLSPATAPITTNQLIGESFYKNPSSLNAPMLSGSDGSPARSIGSGKDLNQQAQQTHFLQQAASDSENDYLPATLKDPASSYEVQAGSIIPALLMTGINSDLPGPITAQVKTPVYDTVSGRTILIPQGARLIGVYDSKIVYGQERVLVAWKHIIFPNGKSINLAGMPGVDLSGYAGFHDQVNHHYGKLFGSVILMSLVSSGAQLSQPQQSINTAPTVNQMIAQSLGANISDVSTELLRKNMSIPPTLQIRPGYELNVIVTQDMVFPGPYEEASLPINKIENHWVTSSELKQLVHEATREGKLKYVLQTTKTMGLPASLALVPMVESHYHNHSVSAKGAAGAWQLMPSTAKEYGLKQQDRFQFKKETHTALQLLKDLHQQFGSWELAFAAYNAGSHRVKTALAKNPKAQGLDDLDLPLETKTYVKNIINLNDTIIDLVEHHA